MNKEKAKRYNKGKTRYELISPIGLKELAKVYTLGAHKYSVYKDEDGKEVLGKDIPFNEISNYTMIEDASSNWKLGQDWTGVMASVKRHIASWDEGEDFDELGTYHIANAAWGLLTLLDFYKTYPELDNRGHTYLKIPKIGLDIDEVIADWVSHYMKRFNITETPTFWHFDDKMEEHFNEIKKDKGFWLTVPKKIEPKDLPFEPHCYITSRSIPIEWTKEWLKISGFPSVKVYQIDNNTSKVDVAKESGCDWFVDDKFENFTELNNAGICCFLMDAPHNQRYNVGHKRIFNLKELVK